MAETMITLDPGRRYFHRPNVRVRGQWLVMSSLGDRPSERVEEQHTSESDAARRVQVINRELKGLRRKAA